jgi:predicted tellurium resistance membrane protein TerC
MIIAVVCAVLVMLVFAGAIGLHRRHRRWCSRTLVLLIGVVLVVELRQAHRKGYIYFAMAFSLFVGYSTCACGEVDTGAPARAGIRGAGGAT